MAESLTDDQQHRRRQAVRELMPTTPYLKGLGIVFERYEPDDVTIRLPFREDLTNDGTYVDGEVGPEPRSQRQPVGVSGSQPGHHHKAGTGSTIESGARY